MIDPQTERKAMAQVKANLASLAGAPRVLIVDDSEADGLLLKMALRGYSETMQVVQVQDMESAIKAISSRRYDLVFLDLLFPSGPDGVEILKRIKQASSVPVLVLTGANEAHPLIKEALAAGAAAILPKPLRSEQISLIFGTP